MVAEIGRYNCFKNSGHPPSWIFDIQFLTVCTVKRPITHHRETPILGGMNRLFKPNLTKYYQNYCIDSNQI